MKQQITIKVRVRTHALAAKLSARFDLPMGDIIEAGLKEIERAGQIVFTPVGNPIPAASPTEKKPISQLPSTSGHAASGAPTATKPKPHYAVPRFGSE